MKKAKVLIILLLILSILSFVVSYLLYTTRENEKEKRMMLEDENAILINKNDSLESKVKLLTAKCSELESNSNKLKEENKSLAKDLMVLKKEKKSAINNLSKAEAELSKIKSKFNSYKAKTADIVSDFKKQNTELLKKIEEYKEKVASYELKLKESGGVSPPARHGAGELPEVVVKAPSAKKAGEVLVVNEKYNFIITNLGIKDGVNIDTKLAVFQNGTLIASAKVEKLYDAFSASGIIKVKDGYKIRKGDKVEVVSL